MHREIKQKPTSTPSSKWVLSLAFALFSLTGFCTDYYVNDNSTTGDVFTTAIGNNSNTGTTAADPKLTLNNLLSTHGASMNAGDNIYIDAGTYNNATGINIPPAKPGISFLGAGYQKTIFDNQLAGAATNFFMYIQASDIYISNMSITGYENNGTQVPGHSAQAITIGGTSGSPVTNVVIENVSFYNNGASGGNPALVVLSYADVTLIGGGSYCNSPGTAYTGGLELFGNNNTLNVQDYILSNNDKALFDGGGLRIEGGNNSFVNVTNTRISNNLANEGGAISQRNGTLTVTDCIIDGNSTSTGGTHYAGAFRIHAGVAKFSRSIFSNNSGASGCRGGAIGARYVSTGGFSSNKTINVTIDSCVFSNNGPSNYGRDVYAAKGYSNPTFVTMTDCQFLTGGNYNIYSGTASSISTTYFGSMPSKTGSNNTRALSANTLWTPTPTPPNFSGVCGSIVILPVELTSFSGYCRNQDNLLQWATATENNNDYFVVDKMNEEGKFIPVGKVQGAGTTTHSSNYEWIDEDYSGSKNYYQLRQVDFDGRSTTYDAISIDQTCSTENVYFNKDQNTITIFHEANSNGFMTVNVLNASGRVIHSEEIQLNKNKKQYLLQLDQNLATGIYLISYHRLASGSHISKLIVH